MDGATAIKAIRKISSHTPLLMMSGYSEGDTVKLACSSPSIAFIQKPFGPDELLNTLQQLLESHPEKKTQSE
jgi:DNA-binding NtrC family response regulator